MAQAEAFFKNVTSSAFNEATRGGVDCCRNFVEISFRVFFPDIKDMRHSPAEIGFLKHVEKGLADCGETSIVSPDLQECTCGFTLVNLDRPFSNTGRVAEDIQSKGIDSILV